MPNDPRVSNISNGSRLKLRQARKAVGNCNVAWVEYGVSIRNLTLAESIQARVQQAKMREPLPYAEVHGLRFDPPVGKAGAEWQSRLLAYEASVFAASP